VFVANSRLIASDIDEERFISYISQKWKTVSNCEFLNLEKKLKPCVWSIPLMPVEYYRTTDPVENFFLRVVVREVKSTKPNTALSEVI
jgi:hypothetical protein